MLEAVVFDFDGLMMDTENAEFQAWSSVFSDFGVVLEMSEWSKCVGGGPGVWVVEDHLDELVGGVDKGAVFREALGRRDAILREMGPREGAVELVRALIGEGVGVGVASSSRHMWVDWFLRQIGLREEISVVWTRDKAGRAKPWPDVYLRALEELGVEEAGRSVAVEDSPNGCKAAVAAGMKVLGCPNDVTRSFFDAELCDLVVGSLGDVSVGDVRGMVGG